MAALYESDRQKSIRMVDSDGAYTWQSAAQTDITTLGFDTRGFDEFVVKVFMGSIASSGTPKIKEIDSSSDNSSFTAVAGSASAALTATDDYKTIIYNMKKKPDSKRYYRVIVARTGANATVDAIEVTLYRKDNGGIVTQDTTVATRETAFGPADGAA